MRINSFKSITGVKRNLPNSSFFRAGASDQRVRSALENRTPFRRSSINKTAKKSSEGELRIVTNTDSAESRLHQSSFKKKSAFETSRSKPKLSANLSYFQTLEEQRRISQFPLEEFETPETRPLPQNHIEVKCNLAVKFDHFSRSALKR